MRADSAIQPAEAVQEAQGAISEPVFKELPGNKPISETAPKNPGQDITFEPQPHVLAASEEMDVSMPGLEVLPECETEEISTETFELPLPPPETIEPELILESQEAAELAPGETQIYFSESGTTSLLPELALPVEEVEQTIVLIAERIEVLEEKPAEEINQILEQIVEKTDEIRSLTEAITEPLVEAEVPTSPIEIEEIKEDVKDLFAQLLDKLEIEYTPELLDCLVNLAVRQELAEFIENENEKKAKSQTEGTHEIIKHLLSVLDSVKDMVAQACRLGRSALQLYSLSPA